MKTKLPEYRVTPIVAWLVGLLGWQCVSVPLVIKGSEIVLWLSIIPTVLALTFPFYSQRRATVMAVSLLLRNHMPIELIDFEGRSIFTLIRNYRDGNRFAHVYWFNCIGTVILMDDGRIDIGSKSAYLLFWMPCKSRDRFLHMLTNDVPDMGMLAGLDLEEKRATLLEAYSKGS